MEKKKTQIEFDGDLEILGNDDNAKPTEGRADFSVPEKEEVYQGPERRRGPRRKGGDRRQELRFETDKTKKDRRSGKDRRKGAWDIKYTI